MRARSPRARKKRAEILYPRVGERGAKFVICAKIPRVVTKGGLTIAAKTFPVQNSTLRGEGGISAQQGGCQALRGAMTEKLGTTSVDFRRERQKS